MGIGAPSSCATYHIQTRSRTRVFAVFEAKDTPTNLHIALDCFREQIISLQSFIWRLVLRCSYDQMAHPDHWLQWEEVPAVLVR